MLKVTISGGPGEGKTTIAQLLADALAFHGIQAEVADLDIEYGCHYPHLQSDRLTGIAQRNEPVRVETVQVLRGT